MGRGKGVRRVWFKGKIFEIPFNFLNSTIKSFNQVVEEPNDREVNLDEKTKRKVV